MVKNPSARARNTSLILGSGISSGEGNDVTPVFLPGKSHGQRHLAGYSPWGCKRVRHNLVIKNNNIHICVLFGSRIQQEIQSVTLLTNACFLNLSIKFPTSKLERI